MELLPWVEVSRGEEGQDVPWSWLRKAWLSSCTSSAQAGLPAHSRSLCCPEESRCCSGQMGKKAWTGRRKQGRRQMWRHRNTRFIASLHHGHPTFACINVHHSALMFISHFVVLSEQGQGAVLPRRVALGNVDDAVGGLGWRFWVTFLLGGKTASEKEHLRFIYPHCQVHKTWRFCFYSVQWQDNSNGGWWPQWKANSVLGLVEIQAAFSCMCDLLKWRWDLWTYSTWQLSSLLLLCVLTCVLPQMSPDVTVYHYYKLKMTKLDKSAWQRCCAKKKKSYIYSHRAFTGSVLLQKHCCSFDLNLKGTLRRTSNSDFYSHNMKEVIIQEI